ncbi:MAG: hypothetical protein JXB24_15675 [Bacteroidales bacterium]|nr:hypothetical protein [Bacteroidales bacterium]
MKKAHPGIAPSRFPQKPIGKKKLLVFKFVAILLPFIFLLLLEAILRLTGYGNSMKLFKEYELDNHYWILNDAVSLKFFTNPENATIGFDEIFRKEKSPETFRIFVLGESTAQGFPYTYNVSFHRWLKYRMMHTFPEINFEIINVALTAVNSYTVLDFAKKITGYEPDAVLIYVGHNEYYGALGVGSTSKLGNNVHLVRFQMKSKQLRLVQLIFHILNKLNDEAITKSSIGDPGLMERMAADYNITYGSRQYERGIKQFEANMNAVCRFLSGKKIPVFISNLVSNEKDMEPFISDTANSEQSAAYQYALAEQAYQKGDFKLAKELYVKAKDMDLLRFRAPEEFNRVIADITTRYSGIYLADTKRLFEEHSPHGILGRETILEHVHPNLFGYALLSESFYQTLKQQTIIALQGKQEMSFEQLLEQMPLSDLDSLKGVYTIQRMMNSWPFNINNNQPDDSGSINLEHSVEGMLADNIVTGTMHWYNAMALLSKHYEETNNLREAFKLAESRVLEFPYEVNAYLTSAREGNKLGEKKKAALYLIKAFQLEPDPAKAEDISILLMDTDQPEKALPYFDYLIAHDSTVETHISSRAVVQEIIRLKSSLDADSDNISLLNQIAHQYWLTQNTDVSLKYINKALEVDPLNEKSLEILEKITGMQPQSFEHYPDNKGFQGTDSAVN